MQQEMNEQIIEQTRLTTLNKFVNEMAEKLMVYKFSLIPNKKSVTIKFDDDETTVSKEVFSLIRKKVKEKSNKQNHATNKETNRS